MCRQILCTLKLTKNTALNCFDSGQCELLQPVPLN